MRIDLFLKVSRIVPRRSVAHELCAAGLIKLNGSVARPSKEVKAGDRIEINRRDRVVEVLVERIPDSKQVSKAGAVELYSVLREARVDIFGG
jgi:ribosomal 50S subunit-recycling heat shock protein